MLTKYSHLFQIDIHHSYFSNGICPGLQIKPTRISQQIMNAYGIRMKNSPSGVVIYQAVEDQGTGNNESKIKAPVVLSFSLESSDPLFLNYTQMDIAESDAKIYFSSTLPSEADGLIPISPKNKVTFTSIQQTIQFSPPPENTALTIKLYTIAGEKIYEEVLSPEDAARGTFQLVIPDEGELLLNLETEDGQVQEQSLYVLSDRVHSYNLLGVLQIVVFPSVAQALLDGQGPVYQLDFSARKTTWRYYFIDRGQNGFDQFKLFKNGEALTEVGGPEAVQLPGGQTAQVMTLQSPMALQERPSDKIELEVSGGSQSLIKLQLPSPNVNRITPGKDENGQQVFYSDIYVYL
ncbi:hypothetical protein [Lewinella sp. LCG006]|uniref:hypothetical protein n=1 Tax=Lewinella sp. LCG006 TaxID=3231911 RepID=UPI003460C218